jgi:hypothetical protein
MATANARFSSNVSYNIVKLDVKLAEKFEIEIVDQPTPTEWYAKADEVLLIKQNDDGSLAQIEATAVGLSKIKIYNDSDAVIMILEIDVLEKIESPAADLNPTPGQPEPKFAGRRAGHK